MRNGQRPKVLVIGSGGREHALVWALSRSPQQPLLYCAPGNAGTAALATNVDLAPTDIPGLAEFAAAERIGLTVAGPEAPLAAGLVDEFERRGLRCFGPTQAAAQIESSKVFARQLVHEARVPGPAYEVFEYADQARAYARECHLPAVFKADGLAAGKGVLIARDRAAAEGAVEALMVARTFGDAGKRIVVEEYLEGDEASVMALCDGETVALLPAARDYKRLLDDDEGPNTGGMGAFAPHPGVDAAMQETLLHTVFEPTLAALRQRGTPYRGVLYAGLMLTADGPKVMEFNCRFGDPETEVVLPLLEGDVLALLQAAALGALRTTPVRVAVGACVCVVLASEGYPFSVRKGEAISGLDEPAAGGALVFHAGTAKRDGQTVTAGGRVVSVTATGSDLDAARARAYAAAEHIHFEGMQYRRDIGRAAVGAAV